MNTLHAFSANIFAAAKFCLFSTILTIFGHSVQAQTPDTNALTAEYKREKLNVPKQEMYFQQRELERLTLLLAKEIKHFKKRNQASKSPNNAVPSESLLPLAEARQTLIMNLAVSSPKVIKRAAIPNDIAEHAPEAIKQFLLTKKELQGKLEVFYEDHPQAELSRLRHVLTTKAGRVELHFANAKGLSKLTHGSKIQTRGLFSQSPSSNQHPLAVIESYEEVLLLEDGTSNSSLLSGSTAPLENTLGEQNTLALLVNFQDTPNEKPWTVEQVQQMLFGSVNDYIMEASYEQTWLTGIVQGYYTLPMDASCETSDIEYHANQSAQDQGIDINNYDRVIYLFPQSSHCTWSGKGTVGGMPSKAWIHGSLTLRTIGHEMGHNFGLHHAKKLDCGTNVLTGECYTVEYGDSLDIMGRKGVTGHFNAFNKDLLGWLTPNTSDRSARIITANYDGQYQLGPYETTSFEQAKALKVFRGNDDVTGHKRWYYLEYRQPIGFDAYLAPYPSISAGALLHVATEHDANSSKIIDLTPDSDPVSDWNDATLTSGNSYSDDSAGVIITTDWADDNSINISVNYSTEKCAKEAPTLTVITDDSQWNSAGATEHYTATITNNNSTGCQDSSFTLSAQIPNGWSTQSKTINVMPGASQTLDMEVTSALSAEDDFYNIIINAQNSSESIYQTSKDVSYVVHTPIEACVLAAPELSVAVANSDDVAPGTTVTYWASLTNHNSSSCGAQIFSINVPSPSGWYSESRSVTLPSGETTSVSIDVASSASAESGVYQLEIHAENSSEGTFNSHSPITYKVADTSTCAATSPKLVIVGDTTLQGEAGSTVSYSAILTNQDSDDCPPASFTIFTNIPQNWRSNGSIITLSPGESTSFSIQVTSDNAASSGEYNFSIITQHSSQSQFTVDHEVSYLVRSTTQSNSAPTALDDHVVLPAKAAMTFNVLANDLDVEGNNLTLISTVQPEKGTVQFTPNGNITYAPSKRFKSSDSFYYTVSNGKASATALVSISLSTQNEDNGGSNKGKGKK